MSQLTKLWKTMEDLGIMNLQLISGKLNRSKDRRKIVPALFSMNYRRYDIKFDRKSKGCIGEVYLHKKLDLSKPIILELTVPVLDEKESPDGTDKPI